MEKNFVELFCGFGVVTDYFKQAGFNTWKTDIRKRKGICEPDLRKNILELKIFEIPFKKIHVLWASLPCDVWSYASGDFHWNKDGYPKTQKCIDHIEILKKSLAIIDELNPDIFFIENPRGRLRNFQPFVKWLEKHHGVIKTLTYSSYGFPATKPTNIFTNAKEISFRELDSFGRGAKLKFKLNNISVCQKQKVPGLLAEHILNYSLKKVRVEIPLYNRANN
ncbi:MAG TPA: DNA cytosine methyltransferase [Candidatus Pacearchaeota archaeon]|uniref:DNA (cytosine-5-)-methyltransferase n=1 Tax=marine sediment metagenome TaxID=412755 RepID=A0A0F9AFA6_9ZZZZ|nr:DNA cytosine methyltransferase [Candidatus Pacearchaeota archaeon]